MIALLTGVTRGIGRTLCLELAAMGYRPAFVARKSEQLDSLLEAIKNLGQNPLWIEGDLRHKESIAALNDLIRSEGLQPDLLILNAGIYEMSMPSVMTAEMVNNMLDANFWHAFNTLQYWMPNLLQSGKGKVVFIGSVVSKTPRTEAAAYSLAKTMLDTYAQLAGAQLRAAGVPVCRIIPGSVNTSSWGDFDGPRHLFVQEQDIWQAVRFLLEVNPHAWVEELVIKPLDESW